MKNILNQTLLLVSILVVLIFSNYSCNDQNEKDLCCETATELGEYKLMPNSLKNSIPYDTNLRIYFNDSLDNEIYLEFITSQLGYRSNVLHGSERECPCDANQWQTYWASTERYVYDLFEPQNILNMSFHLSLNNRWYGSASLVCDVLWVSYATDNPNMRWGLVKLLVDQRELTAEYIEQFMVPKDSVFINGQTYFQVYVNEDNKMFYNNTIGIIAFSDRQEKMWYFNRIEAIE